MSLGSVGHVEMSEGFFWVNSDAPKFHVPHSTRGHDIPSSYPLVVGEIHIAPIVISHIELNILKFQVFNTCFNLLISTYCTC